MKTNAETVELKKGKVPIIVKIIEYLSNAVVSKTIVKKITSNITASAFDAGEELAEKTSPFDNYIQIILGDAVLIINEKKIQAQFRRRNCNSSSSSAYIQC